ncbi:hypothetical protein [Variovorax guangxiensis]|uniref:GAF domain-containing protein n=1 Tax=Variovorax guangxiensis TaxID=1775474 RepID=A0A502DVX3_9BURK|nr:hypothetical protein [Variovorax guangxiensis]RZI67351.1 MAG: hypothetical protein EOP79_06735 [Variovorax sp.]TPG24126.1 hypothetical protein EAH83_06400 [Variovorax ginsengisoli]TPG28376.1 hypothetical protein EAH82_06060 [Variovorax guangxiensis]
MQDADLDIDLDYAPDALAVQVSELLIATPDMSDPLIHRAVHQVLKLLREQQHLDAAFACEVRDGRRIFRRFSPGERAQLIDEREHPLELAFCKQVVRATAKVGCYLSAPMVLNDGRVYGTFYAFSFGTESPARLSELRKLEMAAQLAARMVEERAPAPSVHSA